MSVSQKNNFFVFIFILLAACICALFWYTQRASIAPSEEVFSPTDVETIETPEDSILELQANVSDITIPAFHESF